MQFRPLINASFTFALPSKEHLFMCWALRPHHQTHELSLGFHLLRFLIWAFRFPFPALAASYLRVQTSPLTPTKTSTSSLNRSPLPGTVSPRRGSRRSSRSHRRRRRRRARSWGAPRLTAWAAPAAPTMAATARIRAATSTRPWCWAGRPTPRIVRAPR